MGWGEVSFSSSGASADKLDYHKRPIATTIGTQFTSQITEDSTQKGVFRRENGHRGDCDRHEPAHSLVCEEAIGSVGSSRRVDAPAEATICRWLRQILVSCPICRDAEGRHNGGLHALRRDLTQLELAPLIRYQRRRRRTPTEVAVDQADAIVDAARRRCPSCGFASMLVSPTIESCPSGGHRRER